MIYRVFRAFSRGVKALTLVVMALPAAADEQWQDTDSIRSAAVDYAKTLISDDSGEVEIGARTLDARLRLRRCEQPLEAYLPTSARISNGGVVGVRCSAPVAWKLFVPITVNRHALVARTTRALPAGHRLQDKDVEWVRQKLRASDTVLIKDRDLAVGKTLRQPSIAGQTIRANMLRASFVVRRGDQVTLAVSNSGLAIRMRGRALANGALGQRVQAKNQSSGRVVEGIVRAQGLIELDVY